MPLATRASVQPRRSRLLWLILAALSPLAADPANAATPANAARPVVAANRAGATAVAAPPGFVQRDGTRLLLDGAPFVFTGMNIYNAATASGWCWYPMTGGVLDESLSAIGTGKEVFRAWFFQFEATVAGRRDWSTFDAALAVARAHNQKVIAVLVDQWGNCEGWPDPASGYKNEEWYRQGYRVRPTGPGLPASYRDWVSEMVTRYRDDPTVLAWQLVNEAEAGISLDAPCSATATQSLVGFATDMAGLVKGIDPNHLLSLGTIGTGQCGTDGDEYQTVHAVSGIDLCEYHDYGFPQDPVPGDEWNGLAVRLRQCGELGKPLITGELGLTPDEADGTLEGRAALLDAKLRGQLDAGVAGVLAWAWRNGANGGSTPNDYYIGPGDPALAVLGAY